MSDRRAEQRLLCAELVRVKWRDKLGVAKTEIMNLEDICESGACLQSEGPVHKGASISIHYDKGELSGMVRYCVYGDLGYFLGVEFEGCRWPPGRFRPKHLFDPRTLTEPAAPPRPQVD